ncbi:MAG: hypothetical protein AB1351_01960 [Thermoproteota archaeon]
MKLPLVDHIGRRVVYAGPDTGYRLLPEFRKCVLCKRKVQLCRVGVLMWFHKRCSQCLLKVD